MSNVITVLTSNGMIAPSFWTDPKSGNDYFLTVQYKENYVKNINGLLAVPLHGHNQTNATRLDAVCTIQREDSPTEVDHYQCNLRIKKNGAIFQFRCSIRLYTVP